MRVVALFLGWVIFVFICGFSITDGELGDTSAIRISNRLISDDHAFLGLWILGLSVSISKFPYVLFSVIFLIAAIGPSVLEKIQSKPK